MEDKTILSIVAMLVLAFLEAVALLQGIDGTIFSFVIAAIAAIAGYEVRALTKK